MHDEPNKITLMQAVGEFLMTQVRPAVDDPAIRFRVLIAANLLRIVGMEMMTEHGDTKRLMSELGLLLGGDGEELPSDPAAQLTQFQAIEDQMEGMLAGRTLNTEMVEEFLTSLLRARLAVVNPRFDLSDTIEE